MIVDGLIVSFVELIFVLVRIVIMPNFELKGTKLLVQIQMQFLGMIIGVMPILIIGQLRLPLLLVDIQMLILKTVIFIKVKSVVVSLFNFGTVLLKKTI